MTRPIGALALVTMLALACASCQAIERESKRSEAYAQMQRGELALDQERYQDAHAAFGRAYAILKSIRDTEVAAAALAGRGMASAGLERHEEAVADYDSALELHAVEGSAGDPWRGMIYSLIGDSQGSISRWSEAVAAFDEALGICQRAHGTEDPRCVRLLIGLVWAWDSRADYTKAQLHLDRAAAITGKPGFDDALLEVYVKFARVQLLTHVGRRAEALDLAQRALAKARSRLAPDHRAIASALNLVGYGFLWTGQPQAALEHFEAGRGILERRYGDKGAETATLTDSVGEAKRELGQFAEALELHEQALEVKRSLISRDTDDTAWVIDNIGRAKLGLGRYDEAITEFDRAMSMVRAIHGPDHPDEARELWHRGLALCGLGRSADARKNLDQALEILGKHFGPDHPDVVSINKQIESCDDGLGADVVTPQG